MIVIWFQYVVWMHPTPSVCNNGGGAVKDESDSSCVEVFGEGAGGAMDSRMGASSRRFMSGLVFVKLFKD